MDGFEQVRGFDAVGGREIGNGAGDFQDTIVGAGGEMELLHRLLEEIAELGVDGTVLADLSLGHAGIGGGFGASESRVLAGTRGLRPIAVRSRSLAGFLGTQLGEREFRGLDVEVGAVDEWAADAGAVALDLRGGQRHSCLLSPR